MLPSYRALFIPPSTLSTLRLVELDASTIPTFMASYSFYKAGSFSVSSLRARIVCLAKQFNLWNLPRHPYIQARSNSAAAGYRLKHSRQQYRLLRPSCTEINAVPSLWKRAQIARLREAAYGTWIIIHVRNFGSFPRAVGITVS